jgi:hypothetical protein
MGLFGVDDHNWTNQQVCFISIAPSHSNSKTQQKKFKKEFSVKNLTNCNPFNSWQHAFLKGDFLKWKFHSNHEKER